MRSCNTQSTLLRGVALLCCFATSTPRCFATGPVSSPVQAAAVRVDQLPGEAYPAASTTLEAALRALFDQAEVVFTGEVTEVRSIAGVMEVRWQVDDAVRGTVAGGQYTLREWAGLWQGGEGRYVRGERALVLLHAPSAAGLSSPVGGADGVIALRGDSGNRQLDMRLLQQRVLVTDAARLRPRRALQAAGGSLAASDALQREEAHLHPARRALSASTAGARLRTMVQVPEDGTAETESILAPVAAPPAPANADSTGVDAAVVLGMLQSWQRQRGAAR